MDKPVDVSPRREEKEAAKGRLLPAWAGGLLGLILRRLLFIALVAFAIVYFCHLGVSLRVNSTGTGPVRTVAQAAGPALAQTLDFFGDALRGELGSTLRGTFRSVRAPLSEVLAETCLVSAQLLLVSIGLATIIGILAGGAAALWRRSPLSFSTLTITVIGVSIPSFFLALLLRVADIAFYRRTGIGLVPVFGGGMDRTQSLLPHLTFPALVLTARPLAHITRVTFVALSEILERDYIRTARSKGLGQTVVFWRHALRNASVAVLTAVIVSFRFALGSLPVVEVFFEWPGIGLAMLGAISRGDARSVAAMGLSLGLTFLLLTLALDLIYRWIDPRLRNGGGG